MPAHSLPPDVVADFLSHPESVRIALERRGSIVFSAGQATERVFIVTRGIVKIECDQGSKFPLILRFAGPGAMVGEEALVGFASYEATASALTRAELAGLPVQVVRDRYNSQPASWSAVCSYIVSTRAAAYTQLVQLAASDVRARITHRLRELAQITTESACPDEPITIPLSQAELASAVAATRETTSTVLNALAREGVVGLGHRAITLMPEPRRAAAVA